MATTLSDISARAGVLFLAPPLILWLGRCFDVGVGTVRGLAWLVAICAFALVMSGLGLYIRKKSFGILADWRNRYSLSRFQIVLWTTLVLPTLYVIFISNIISAWGKGTSATNIDIEWTLVSLMGISVSSFLASPLALSVKSNQEANPEEAQRALTEADNGADQVEGKLIRRAKNATPSFSDLFLGEEVGNAGTLDLARLQMLGLTLIVWTAYALELSSSTIFRNAAEIAELPKFSETLLTLLLLSHGGYITGKLIPHSQKPKEDIAADLARLNGISMRADTLISKLGATSRSDDDPSAKAPFERLKAQLNTVLTEAQVLNGQAADGGLDTTALSRLEGRLDGVAASFDTAEDARTRILADLPSQDLLKAVRAGLTKAGFSPSPAPGAWTARDEAAVQAFLLAQKIDERELSKNLVNRLEELEDLTA
jgi:hypothetical protein